MHEYIVFEISISLRVQKMYFCGSILRNDFNTYVHKKVLNFEISRSMFTQYVIFGCIN